MYTSLLEHPAVMLSIALLVSFVISLAIIPAIIRVACEKHLMDEPNGRSSHQHNTPNFGGVAIFAAIIIVFIMSSYWINTNNNAYLQVLPAIIILFFIGLKDDILVIDPTKKLVAQLIAGSMVILVTDIRIGSFYGMLGVHDLSYWVSFGITLFIFIAITNAYNLIDGIDGLAGCLSVVAAVAYGMYFAVVGVLWGAVLCATLTGALIGFLRFNFSKTQKIFMGDSGSLIIGFILSVLSVKFIQFNELPNAWHISNAPTLAIAVMAIPLFDTLRVFSHRLIIHKTSPFTPDRNHIHHLIVDRGNSHTRTTVYLTIASVLITAMSYTFFAQASIAFSLSAMVLIFAFYAWAAQRRHFLRISKLYVSGRPTPRKQSGSTISELSRDRDRDVAALKSQAQSARATSVSV